MIKEFTIGCSKTQNLGNYQSLRVEASVTIAVDDDADFHDIKETAQQELKALLEETYKAQYKHADRTP